MPVNRFKKCLVELCEFLCIHNQESKSEKYDLNRVELKTNISSNCNIVMRYMIYEVACICKA